MSYSKKKRLPRKVVYLKKNVVCVIMRNFFLPHFEINTTIHVTFKKYNSIIQLKKFYNIV